MTGVKGTLILKTEGEGEVLVAEDTETNACTIGIRTGTKYKWEFISKELHDLLVKELAHNQR